MTLAISVFPVPGGPTINNPLGNRAPASMKGAGSFIIDTSSCRGKEINKEVIKGGKGGEGTRDRRG